MAHEIPTHTQTFFTDSDFVTKYLEYSAQLFP